MSSGMRSAADSSEDEANLEDTPTEMGNNSILGKVKSRVSSILPNKISKWFSPSTRTPNDSQNGSLNVTNNSGMSRRRRRIEIEAEDEDDEDLVVEDDDDGEEEDADEDTEQQVHRRQYEYSNTATEKAEDDGNNSEEENVNDTTPKLKTGPPKVTSRRSINREDQPPIKKLRAEHYQSHIRENTLLSHQPLVASTPAVGSQMRGLPTSVQLTPSHNTHRKYLNLSKYYNSEQPYNFTNHLQNPTKYDQQKSNLIDLVSNQGVNAKLSMTINADGNNEYISSRRNLNIGSATNPTASLAHRRPPLTSFLNDAPSTSAGISHRTSFASYGASSASNAVNADSRNSQSQERGLYEENNELTASNLNNNNNTKCNGRAQNVMHSSKKQKLINGGNAQEESNAIETGSEGSEASSSTATRKSCLPNTADSSRAGSRTSSVGNGLNFYAHLEGRKSLFSGAHAMGSRPPAFNNSTLSLTSLNRRQFNASIYGSTSALSDSRLLENINTSSPFYKGRTTYGGAAAYNKYSATGAGASSARITPTAIRPTSSLSTLSSSNASVVGGSNTLGLVQTKNEHPHLSNTAKGILNIINEFSTPLNEVKKLANNLRTNNQHQPLTARMRNRLNETHLQASRSMRLCQVSKPYARPPVTLTAKQNNGTKNANSSFAPPVRELQVPSMSQLLQMKKVQCTTERSREISSKSIMPTAVMPQQDYTLPIQQEVKEIDTPTTNQKHTSKIRAKVTNSGRISSTKIVVTDDNPPSPVNLPNIAFPLMTAMPKIDIQLPTAVPTTAAPKTTTTGAATTFHTENTAKLKSNSVSTTNAVSSNTQSFTTAAKPMFSFSAASNGTKAVDNKFGTMRSGDSHSTTNTVNFKFSTPLAVQPTDKTQISTIATMATSIKNFKFSAPPAVIELATSVKKTAAPVTAAPAVPKLKTGSVLEALKMNSSVPAIANAFGSQTQPKDSKKDSCVLPNKPAAEESEKPKETESVSGSGTTSMPLAGATSFGSQFQKAANEWECDVCMIRNKSDVAKCIACETPKNGGAASSTVTTINMPPITNSFGDAFKAKANTWECPTCLINNKSDSNECVACQTKNPSAKNDANANASTAAPATPFKFGFAAAQNTPAVKQDSAFQTLAAQQKASSWECEACLTRNDAARTKCICCEQAKPGTQATTDSTTFSFGTSAATKFSFGFAPNSTPATTAKDKTDETTKDSNKSNAFGSVSSSSAPTTTTTGTFSFGFQPTAAATTTVAKKDDVDNAKSAASFGLKFGSNATAVSATAATSNATTTTTTSTSATSGFTFGLGSSTTTTASGTFTLPTVTTATATTKSNFAPSFTFGTTNAQKTTETTVAAAAKTGDFAFKVPPTPATTSAPISIESNKSAAPTTAATPMFSFSAPAVTSTSATTSISTTTSTVATPATSAFTFGTSATNATPANKTLFGIVSSSSATPSITTPTASNIFGISNNSSTTTTAVTSTTSTFGSFTASNAGANVFGSFGQTKTGDSNPTSTLFGNTAANSLATNAAAPTFSFGAATGTAATPAVSTAASTTMPSSSWPKKAFVFGSSSSSEVDANKTNASTIEAGKTALFGNFGASNNSTDGVLKSSDSAPPAYGAATAQTQAAPPAYGSSGIFGTNSSTPALGTSNIFGTSTSGNATTPQVPAFGAAPAFGGSAAATNVTPTFGSTAASAAGSTTFGNTSALSATPTFGSFSAAAAAGTSSTVTPATNQDIKKPEPFKFTNPTESPATAGVFKFGASAAPAAPKPAFNLTAPTTIQPNFNFTGSTEATPSAPFQFNAGTAPANPTNNIFAPTPTPGSQSAQQLRRKIRGRRLPPR